MKKKPNAQSGLFSLRTLASLLVCAAAMCSMIVTGTLLAFWRSDASEKVSHPEGARLTFAARVSYQRAIEEVYWRHRIWPKENSKPKPSLDAVLSQAQLEKTVTDYLRNSQALEDYWQRPILAEQLQAEMDRMAKETKQPDVLHEMFAALGNDPFVIAECLARPALADRLLRNWYAHDQRIHGDLKNRAEADLLAHPTFEQMKQTSGAYSEIELVKSESPREEAIRRAGHGVKLSSEEWNNTLQKLAATFRDLTVAVGASPAKPALITQIKTGFVSTLQEDETHYYATAVIEKTDNRLKLTTVSWPKDPLESWLSRMEHELLSMVATIDTRYTLPKISAGPGCVDDTWTATAAPPDSRFGHTAVWTGSEMVIWGGYDGTNDFNTGYRYNPATDTWTATSTVNAPEAREYHTAVWTGIQMIVWGGSVHDISYPNTGGKYDPSTDTWVVTSTVDAPTGRYGHTAVWTGTEMIVWGGYNGNANGLNTGGRYNPTTESWAATSTTNAPTPRFSHTATLAGNRMIVWGGYSFSELNSGGRYNPGTDSWAATNTVNAPDARDYHTAISTGNEMIIWGGHNNAVGELNTGSRYNPGTDTWMPTSTANAPSARANHTATWTGSEMIVWAGYSGTNGFNSGGKYNPTTDSWIATSTNNAPTARGGHTAVWTGSEIIVWGGGGHGPWNLNTGGRYNPTTDSWIPTNSYDAPTARHSHTAVWTGTEMIVWGGVTFGLPSTYWNTGETYGPATDSWSAINLTNAPVARESHSAVWTGTEMIVWGGVGTSGNLNTGGRYSPGTDSWVATSTTNAPAARDSHIAVWTGTEMIVWGGDSGSPFLNTGGKYNPSTDSWAATSTTNAPTARDSHTGVWTGSEMIIWGGIGPPCNPSCVSLNTGGRYNPSADSWAATSITNPPSGRGGHTAVWTESEMIVWGGHDFFNNRFSTGGKYNPETNGWIPTSTTNAPVARDSHTGLWTANEMIIWGGTSCSPSCVSLNTGGRYNPSADTWRPTNTTTAPVGREAHTVVWTGNEMIVWGGDNNPGSDLNTGGRYCGQSGVTPTPTPTATATATATTTPTLTPTPTVSPTATPPPTASPTPSEPSATPSPTSTTTPAPRITPAPRPHPTPAPRP